MACAHLPAGIRRIALTICLSLLTLSSVAFAAGVFGRGDLVRLTRSESLLFKGERFNGGAKGQEFTVLQHDVIRKLVYVPFYKDDGTLIAVSIPAEALEPAQADAWNDLVQGAEAFRDLRVEDAKRLLARAAQDPAQRQLALAISGKAIGTYTLAGQVASAQGARVATAKQAFLNSLQALREAAAQLAARGNSSLAVPLDIGADRLAAQVLGAASAGTAAPTKLNRAEVEPKATAASSAALKARQAMALHRMVQAAKVLDEGIAAEPSRTDLKALRAKAEKAIADAEESHKSAESMRRFEKGAVHALTALERGLKYCADHPKLLALRKEMQALFEERTAPPVSTAMLSGGLKAEVLEEGRKLYTTRCTECHDLELLDSRSMPNWRTAVAGMARRADLSSAEQNRIIDYLAAAQSAMADDAAR